MTPQPYCGITIVKLAADTWIGLQISAGNELFTITETFSWLEAPTRAFTFNNLLRPDEDTTKNSKYISNWDADANITI